MVKQHERVSTKSGVEIEENVEPIAGNFSETLVILKAESEPNYTNFVID